MPARSRIRTKVKSDQQLLVGRYWHEVPAKIYGQSTMPRRWRRNAISVACCATH
jgi:hypothetical protein